MKIKRLLTLVSLISGLIVFANSSVVFASNCALSEQFYSRAKHAGTNNNFELAERELMRSVELCGQHKSWHMLGVTRVDLQDYSGALEAFDQAQTIASTDNLRAVSMARYAEALALSGGEVEAVSIIQHANKLHADAPDWMQSLAKELDYKVSQKPLTKEIITRSFGAYKPQFMPAKFSPSINLRINFEFNSTVVDRDSFDNLSLLVSVIEGRDYEGKKFKLVGHTDVRGEEGFNKDLSYNRAVAVKDYILSKNPKLANRLLVAGAGESDPLYKGNSEEDHRLNRRLQIVLE